MSVFGPSFRFDEDLTLGRAWDIIQGSVKAKPSRSAHERCKASHDRLKNCIASNRHVYGVTTGFGPLANRLIDPQYGNTLQQNLINHLATGLGEPIPWAIARGVCLARLNTIMKGYSGASQDTIDCLVRLLNSDFAPIMPERGTVGASGDLTPLAHLVLAFQGHGAFQNKEGKVYAGRTGLDALGIKPLKLTNRDGLALVNGTSAMTGFAIHNSTIIERLVDWSLVLSAACLDVLEGRPEAWSPIFSKIRPHRGQLIATNRLNSLTEFCRNGAEYALSDRKIEPNEFETEETAGQDAYSLRCVPQIVGAVVDTTYFHNSIVETELNSVTDNPIFPPGNKYPALHGGNFMGQHIALASDSASLALTVLAGLIERQIARITDEKLNNGLPPFLSNGRIGLTSGFMGAQVTATSTIAEMRCQGLASVHSISTNAANQDVVSMGTIAARSTARQAHYLSEVLAIGALCVAQAADIRLAEGKTLTEPTKNLNETIRNLSDYLATDRPLYRDIEIMADFFKSKNASCIARF